jgi:hypothetical protein
MLGLEVSMAKRTTKSKQLRKTIKEQSRKIEELTRRLKKVAPHG